MTIAYPLQWPQGQKRTPVHQQQRAKFDVSQNTAQIGILEEIKRLGGRNPVISTNIKVRNDGLPYATQGKIDDVGVAVYFTLDGENMCFACDKWDQVKDNMRAVQKTIDAIRGIARWGSGDMMKRAFTGFTALPAPSQKKEWWDVLMVKRDSAIESIEANYRSLAREHHPDNGGDSERMAEINAAMLQARKERSK